MKAIKIQNPSGRGKFGGPHDIELQNVGIGGAGVEPLHIQLMAIVGSIGRRAHFDAQRRMTRLESRELASKELGLAADRAP
jgi:hypothetical protein